ncbi:MAG: helix-turn-helix domain-containing protein [Acutalibacteraceae bacterium]
MYEEQNENYKKYVPQVEPYTIPRVISIKAAAKEFSISEWTIRRWIKSGQLPVVKCGNSFLINCTVFSKFLEGQCQPVTVEPLKPVAVGENGELFAEDTPSKRKGKAVNKIKPIF